MKEKIIKIAKFVLFPLTILLFIAKVLLKGNLDGAKKDIQDAEDFEKKKSEEIKVVESEVGRLRTQEEKTKAKLEAIEEMTGEDWNTKE